MRTLTLGGEGPSQEASTRHGRILGRRSRWKYHRRFQKMMGWAAGSSGNASTSLPSFSTSDSSSLRSTRGLRYAHAPPSTRREAPCQAQRGRAVEGMYHGPTLRAMPPLSFWDTPGPLGAHLPSTTGGPHHRVAQHPPHYSSRPFCPSPYPHVPIAELGLFQGKAEPAVTEHRAWAPRDRSVSAATGISKGRLGAGDTVGGQQEGSALGPPLPCPTHSTWPIWGHLGRESRVWTLSRGTKGQAQKGQVVLRLESSGAQPAMISSSYTSESQARHREQLDSRICRQEGLRGSPARPAGSGIRAPS